MLIAVPFFVDLQIRASVILIGSGSFECTLKQSSLSESGQIYFITFFCIFPCQLSLCTSNSTYALLYHYIKFLQIRKYEL